MYKRESSKTSNVLDYNKENELKLKIKKESKELYSNNTTKRGTKKINSKDPIKAKQDKYKDKEIKTSKDYTLFDYYRNRKIKKKLIKDLKIKTETKKIIKNSIFKKSLKNCDISLKKNKNNIFMIIKDSSKIKYHSYENDGNVCKKILGDSKKKKINKKKYIRINRILFDDHFYNYTDDDEFYGDILESDNYNNKIINEIKTNNFEVKKPKEQEMKYTILNGLQEKEESNDQESHISKIIIGEINGYKDIIEKDKITGCLSNEKENLNEIKKLKDLLDESNETETKIIDMINFEYDTDKMPTNDFKIIQKNKNETGNNN